MVDLELLKESIGKDLEVLGSYVTPNDYDNFSKDLNIILEKLDHLKLELKDKGEPYNHIQNIIGSLEVLVDEHVVNAKEYSQPLTEIFESVVGTLQDIIE